jgi:seryl-tRNA synthetase
LLFELRAECTFSKKLEPARPDIKDLLAQASRSLLLKGAPRGKEAEAARIRGWRMVGKKLELRIESGRYVRAHDALLRLIKLLGAELGREHKIGMREVRVREYRITLPTAEPSKQVKRELQDLPCKIGFTKRGVVLTLRDLSESDLRGRMVDRLVAMAVDILAKVPVPPTKPRVVQQSKPLKHPFQEDPFKVAKRLDWVAEFPGRGQWVYTAPYADLLRAIEDILIEKIALELGFREIMFPKLIPLEVMQRMPGYLDELPEGMYYVSPPPREPEVFTSFKKQLKLTKRVPTGELERCLKEPAYVLAPAQCEPFYDFLARQELKLEDMPIKVFDRSGWTYRWEGGAVEGLIRTQEFRRIEFVFAGKPDDVVQIRDATKDKSIEVADELGLEWRVLVATPFYMRTGGIEEDVSDSRKVATYDIEVRLPYRKGWLELGSYNVHRTKFVKTFRIKEIKGREIWTGCSGFGTSRWVLGFLAQHGFDVDKWPRKVRERVRSKTQKRAR